MLANQHSDVDQHYAAKQQSVQRKARQHDPAYGGNVRGWSDSCTVIVVQRNAVVGQGLLSCSAHNFVILFIELPARLFVLLLLQEHAARHELLAQADSIQAARQGTQATSIGFGLPGEAAHAHCGFRACHAGLLEPTGAACDSTSLLNHDSCAHWHLMRSLLHRCCRDG